MCLVYIIFPSMADIYKHAESIRRQREGKRLPDADEAWEEVMQLVHNFSLYAEWEFSCDEVAETVKNYGKKALCLLEEGQLTVARAQFMKIYDAVVARRRDQRLNEHVMALVASEQSVDVMEGTDGKVLNSKKKFKLLKNT